MLQKAVKKTFLIEIERSQVGRPAPGTGLLERKPERGHRSGSSLQGSAPQAGAVALVAAGHTKDEKPVSAVRAPGPAGANTALCVVTTVCSCGTSPPATASYLWGAARPPAARRFHEL